MACENIGAVNQRVLGSSPRGEQKEKELQESVALSLFPLFVREACLSADRFILSVPACRQAGSKGVQEGG